MTKLQLLNSYLTERLMVAVGEILEVVEGAVLEYEEETARTRRENQLLKRRLREVGLGLEWTGSTRPVPESTSPAGPHQWTSDRGPEPEPAFNPQDAAAAERNEDPALLSHAAAQSDGAQWKAVFAGPLSLHAAAPEAAALPPAPGGTPPPCVKKDLDPCSVESLLGACGEDGGAGLDGIKSEPLDAASTDSANETAAAALAMYAVSDVSEGGARYVDDAHPGADPASANGSAPDAAAVVFQHIDSSGRLSAAAAAPEPDFLAASRAGPAPAGRDNRGGRRSHPCPQCGKSFSHVSRLKIHQRIHTGEKPFVCALCGKRFNNDGTLRNHRRVHTELRLYDCPACGMSFKDAYTCRKHQRVHGGARTHACAVCGKSFATPGSLSTHLHTHTFHIA